MKVYSGRVCGLFVKVIDAMVGIYMKNAEHPHEYDRNGGTHVEL